MLDLEVVLTVEEIFRYKWMVVISTIIGWEALKFTVKFFYRRWTKKRNENEEPT